MSTTLIIILLVVLALLLFVAEALILPGHGISGICAGVCVIVADVMIYQEYGTQAAILAVLISTAIVLLFFWWFAHSKTLDRMSLHSTISSTSATPSQLSVKAGDTGVATTRLALIGNAKIADCDVEVKSEDGFINEGTPIIVTRVNEALILVKKRSDK